MDNLKEAKAALKQQIEAVKSKEYTDWDSLVITLALGDKAPVSIKMMRHDMETMAETHLTKRADVIEMMIQALEEEAANSGKTKEEKE
jgi:hypothetical protein